MRRPTLTIKRANAPTSKDAASALRFHMGSGKHIDLIADTLQEDSEEGYRIVYGDSPDGQRIMISLTRVEYVEEKA